MKTAGRSGAGERGAPPLPREGSGSSARVDRNGDSLSGSPRLGRRREGGEAFYPFFHLPDARTPGKRLLIQRSIPGRRNRRSGGRHWGGGDERTGVPSGDSGEGEAPVPRNSPFRDFSRRLPKRRGAGRGVD